MAQAQRKARMSDVALAAGVAPATVSRALNRPDKLAAGTLARVYAAIDQLGYLPDLTAGSLASSRSFIVGAVVPTLANSWFAESMEGLAAELAPHGYQLLLAQSSYHPDAEAGSVNAFLGRRVDAVVLTGRTHSASLRERLRAQGLPVVELWDLPARPLDMAVGFSHEAVGREVGHYLRAKGHRAVGFIGADEERSRLRLRGLCEGLDRAAPAVFVAPPSTVASGREAMAALCARQSGLSAVFCSNDLLAIGALHHCRDQGLEVPERMAVVGFSDLAVAEAAAPPLTTVRVEAVEMGRQAARLLLQRLQGPAGRPVHKVVDVGFRLVARATA